MRMRLRNGLVKVAAIAGVSGSAMMTSAIALAADRGKEVVVSASEIFVPNGYDDNDEIVVVLDGYLPNSCYKLSKTKVSVEPSTKKIIVTQTARRYPGPCLMALVPFSSNVQLGMLPRGKFAVLSNEQSLKEGLEVHEASNAGPDDHLYAPVDHVTVREKDGVTKAMIEGRFTNSCMEIEDIKVVNSGKTIEVLPLLNIAQDRACAQVEVPYSKVVELPKNLREGRHLLHVRSLNGSSINTMFTVKDE